MHVNTMKYMYCYNSGLGYSCLGYMQNSDPFLYNRKHLECKFLAMASKYSKSLVPNPGPEVLLGLLFLFSP